MSLLHFQTRDFAQPAGLKGLMNREVIGGWKLPIIFRTAGMYGGRRNRKVSTFVNFRP